jgi:hypothetical protein
VSDTGIDRNEENDESDNDMEMHDRNGLPVSTEENECETRSLWIQRRPDNAVAGRENNRPGFVSRNPPKFTDAFLPIIWPDSANGKRLPKGRVATRKGSTAKTM